MPHFDNKYTIKITTGAMMIAIFTIMLFINRQTGMMFEEMLLYLFPLPMIVFATKYGWKDGIPVMIAMCLMSFLFGTINTIFYAATESFLGLVLGGMLNRKTNLTKTMLVVMVLAAIINVLNTIVLASLFGYNIAEEITEMQNMLATVYTQAGLEVPTQLLTSSFIFRILVISMTALGVLQGYIIVKLSILIMRRLRITVPMPEPIYSFYPPRWSGLAALILFFAYLSVGAVENPTIAQSAIQTAGICGYLYATVFGAIGGMLVMRAYGLKSKLLRSLIVFFLCMSLTPIALLIGFVYILSPQKHADWLTMANR